MKLPEVVPLPWRADEDNDVVAANGHLVGRSCAGPEVARLIAQAPYLIQFAEEVASYAARKNDSYLCDWAAGVVTRAGGELPEAQPSRDDLAAEAQQVALGIGGHNA